MTVENGQVVAMNYTLTDDAGKVIDSSEGEPLEYLQGYGNIIPGLEKAMMGHKVGDKFTVKVSPEEGYGVADPEKRFEIERAMLGETADSPKAKVGMMAKLNSDNGVFVATIVELTEKTVVFDANHPLAGQNLNFDVEITSIRKATPEEIENEGLIHECSGSCHECGGCH